MHVLELKIAPLQPLQLQQRNLVGTLGTEMSHRPTAVGDTLRLLAHGRYSSRHLCQAPAVGRIEYRTARVEEHLVVRPLEGAHLHVRHMPHQTVFQGFALHRLKVILLVGQRHLSGTRVDSCRQAVMEKGKADDAVLTLSHHITTHALHLETADGQRLERHRRQLHRRHLTVYACGVFRLDVAQFLQTWHIDIVVDDPLTGSRVELEAILPSSDSDRQVYLATLHLNGYCRHEVLPREQKVGVVALQLRYDTATNHRQQHCQKYFFS